MLPEVIQGAPKTPETGIERQSKVRRSAERHTCRTTGRRSRAQWRTWHALFGSAPTIADLKTFISEMKAEGADPKQMELWSTAVKQLEPLCQATHGANPTCDELGAWLETKKGTFTGTKQDYWGRVKQARAAFTAFRNAPLAKVEELRLERAARRARTPIKLEEADGIDSDEMVQHARALLFTAKRLLLAAGVAAAIDDADGGGQAMLQLDAENDQNDPG